MTFSIRPADPTDERFEILFDRHLTLMHASSPACSVHAKPASGLTGEHVTFLVGFLGADPVAMGAVQDLGAGHYEVKSMHVLDDHRGQGFAQAMLAELLRVATEKGAARVSLETGSQPVFARARAFYAAAGFQPTQPFADYTDDPNSYYMTLALAD